MILLIWLQLLGNSVAFQTSHHLHSSRIYSKQPKKISSSCLHPIKICSRLSATVEKISLITIPASEWDEQLDALRQFKEEYGHCNFPQTAPARIEKKYPKLYQFCHNQRLLHHRERKSASQRSGPFRSLSLYDRNVRLRKLDEMGFEFNIRLANWYDRYHELVEYHHQHGNCNVKREDLVLYTWILYQRRKQHELAEEQIRLLDAIAFPWEPDAYDNRWDVMYNQLKEFHSEHGHFNMAQRQNRKLYLWMSFQLTRLGTEEPLRGAPLTKKQIKLLDEIGLSSKPDLLGEKWNETYSELVRFQKDHGHCRPTESTSSLYQWTATQRVKRRKCLLTEVQIELLETINFPWTTVRQHRWVEQYRELCEFYDKHGHLRVERENDPSLYDWIAALRRSYSDSTAQPRITDSRIEQLERYHFCWSSDWKERTWHEKYTEAAEFWKEHGHIRVAEKDNPSLFNWIETQGKRHRQLEGHKPLSNQELEMLEQIDFGFLENQPRIAWIAMYDELVQYQEKSGGKFPNSHQDDPDLNRWMRQQRMRYRSAYGHAGLTDEQKELLHQIDFPWAAECRQGSWCERYDELVGFHKQHGHFLVDPEKDTQLYDWAQIQRKAYKRAQIFIPLSPSQVYLLDRIGFPWESNRSEIAWQRRYDELVKFQEEHGHLRVTFKKHQTLHSWVQRQRLRYKAKQERRLTDEQIRQLEKIGFQWSSSLGRVPAS